MQLVTPLTAGQVLADAPVIPVITVSAVDEAVALAAALVRGGLRMLEITLRTPQALDCIAAVADQVPGAVPGAGTVRTPDDAQAAAVAGARFLISPGYSADLAAACRALALPFVPGAATASEVMVAAAAGFHAQKLFPAVPAGGLALLQAWHAPFPDVRFCPTGGITATTAPQFLALPNVACVGGSWVVPPAAIRQRDWDAITRLAAAAVALRTAGAG